MKGKGKVCEISLGPWAKLDTKITSDNIYIGDIYKCGYYQSKIDDFFESGGTDYEGLDRKTILKTIHKKNAVLVRLNSDYVSLYVELDKLVANKTKGYLKKFPSGGTKIILSEDSPIMDREPFAKDILFVDENSLKKVNYSPNNNSSKSKKVYRRLKK